MATNPSQKQGQSFGTQAPDAAQVALEINVFEEELARLKARFEQYFLGIERINPTQDYEDYKKRLLKLKNQFHRNTAVKFRLATLHNKFITYERLWQKTLKDIEEGRYVRDLKKLKRKNELKKQKEPEPAKDEQQADAAVDEAKKAEKPKQKGVYTLEDLEADLPDELFGEAPTAPKPPAPPPAAARPPPPPPGAQAAPAAGSRPPPPPPAAAARPPPPPAAAKPPPPPGAAARPPPPPAAARPGTVGGLSDEKISQIYNAYVTAKRRCKESTDGITPDALAKSLRQQVPKLMEQHGVKSVDFKVVIKDGKAVLKAVPK